MKGWATSLSKDSTFLILCVCHFPTLEHKVCARCHSRFGNFPTLIVGQASIPACNQAYYYYANWLLQRRLCILFLRTYYYLMDCAISLSALLWWSGCLSLLCTGVNCAWRSRRRRSGIYICVSLIKQEELQFPASSLFPNGSDRTINVES